MRSSTALGFATLLLLATATGAGVTDARAAKPHACAADAVEHAKKLLRFHLGEPTAEQPYGDGETAIVKAPIKPLRGKGKFDVLEVTSGVYKAEYRMRFIYAQIPGECLLMGQEMLEASNPY